MNFSFRTAARDRLAAAAQDARNYTLALFDCLAAAGLDAACRVPMLPIVNPPLWELGHVAWFAEWYILRGAQSSDPASAQCPSLLPRADAWFDSNRVPHDRRWTLDLPPTQELNAYCGEVLCRILDRLAAAENDDASLYPYRLALAHEDMHGEAFAYTLQTLGVTAPAWLEQAMPAGHPCGEIRFAGGTIELGNQARSGFAFDNEKPAQVREVAPFAIDATLVSVGQYRRFVEDGGYRKPQFWTLAGRAWLSQQQQALPLYWQSAGTCVRFGKQTTMPQDEPMRHVSLFEAQAYCAWAGRRLPTEAEWEYAAQSAHPAFRWGELWEWTGSPFAPYPGFSADAYREYSQPWFGTHQAVRGASFATRARLRSCKFRNFYLPHRNDIFIGFRTCAANEA